MNEDYRPATIEFDVANSSPLIPESLGVFENAQKAAEFMAKNLTAINHKLTAVRFMDNTEKILLRKDYQSLLEDKLPALERDFQKVTGIYEVAKKVLGDAKEACSATTNEAKAIAVEVKRGLKDITLDDQYTWRVPFMGRYFFYTFIDGQVKLCKVQEIPEWEKQDLFNAMNTNEGFFNPQTKEPIPGFTFEGGDGSKENPATFSVPEKRSHHKK